MKLSIRWVLLAVVVIGSFLTVGSLAYAQGYKAAHPVTPKVLSGGDIGFRVESVRGETPVGRLVVKVNEKWVDIEFSSGMSILTKAQ